MFCAADENRRVGAAELVLLAGMQEREQPVQQHPAVAVGARRVDELSLQLRRRRRACGSPSTMRMLPTTACSSTSAGIAFVVRPSSTALSSASICARRRVLGDDRRPARLVAQVPRARDAAKTRRREHAEARDRLQPAPRRGEVRRVERRERPLLEPDRDRDGLVRRTRGAADAATVAAPSLGGIRGDLARLPRALVADVAGLRSGERARRGRGGAQRSP